MTLFCPDVRAADLPGPTQREVMRLDPEKGFGAMYEGMIRTVEGDPERDDPARVVSPVYQDIENHPVQGGVCLLLTGQAAPHHFSAVVTARRDGASYLIETDIADRCRAPVEVLAATYVLSLSSDELIDAGPERIVWGGGRLGRSRLEFSSRGVDDIALAEAGRTATRVQALARLVPTTYTQRLYYCWRWTPSPSEETEPWIS
jgi:hypothetical protein